ncbi:MAG TPA: ABC transporter permease [Thermoplasmata archaeon]|jgi:peptide/nickel transport system permease protein
MGVARHLAKRAIFLVITFMLAILATVIIANGGGRIDSLLRDQVRFDLLQRFANDRAYQQLPPEERDQIFNDTLNRTIEARGLNEPFLQKTMRYTLDALQFRLGRAITVRATDGSRQVADIIFERLPRSLVLFTSANILAAVVGIWLGLWMARKALSVFDRGMTIISVTTFIVPPWVYGILFLLFFAFEWKIFPAGGFVSVPPPPPAPLIQAFPPVIGAGLIFGGYFYNSFTRVKYHKIGYAVMLAGVGAIIVWLLLPYDWFKDVEWHMVLPMIAVAFSVFGSWAYTTRNLVLQVMDEDFVFAARAKGLKERDVLSKYVLRAASPPIITSLALTLAAAWTGAIITETVFNYPGLGLLFFEAITVFDAPVVIGLTVMYALLLVITVFLLDLTYSMMDPRIKALRR